MKKILLIVCVFVASYSYAQDLKFGAKAGLNLSTLVGDDVDNVDMKAGFYFGGFLNVPLSYRLSFQPELLYSRQGWKEDINSVAFEGATVEVVDLKYKTTYLSIPLLLKMSIGTSDNFHIYAGPQIGFLLKAEAGIENFSNDQDVKNAIRNVDFSLNLGSSFNVSDNMALDIRYNRGLSKVYDYKNGIDLKEYNSVIQLGAAYTF